MGLPLSRSQFAVSHSLSLRLSLSLSPALRLSFAAISSFVATCEYQGVCSHGFCWLAIPFGLGWVAITTVDFDTAIDDRTMSPQPNQDHHGCGMLWVTTEVEDSTSYSTENIIQQGSTPPPRPPKTTYSYY